MCVAFTIHIIIVIIPMMYNSEEYMPRFRIFKHIMIYFIVVLYEMYMTLFVLL